ncbi:MAG: exodeoxyribonuclease V subunit alpha [bacterium]
MTLHKPSTSVDLAATQFVQLMNRLNGKKSTAVTEIAETLMTQLQQGRIAVPVNFFKQDSAWLNQALQQKVIGYAHSFTPIIYDHGYFYLYRYWDYQQRLIIALNQRMQTPAPFFDYQTTPSLAASQILNDCLWHDLQNYFPNINSDNTDIDWQKFAAASALLKRFLIISGGPGTGKTTTVTKILILFAKAFESFYQKKPRIILAAPTGKAAMRMQESIRHAGLPKVLDYLSQEAATLHRVLGYIPHQINFQHHQKNPLAADIVIVDEASMIDLALFTKFIEAVPSEASLILLGDKDQLASVETGSVFSDLCAKADNPYSPEYIKQTFDLQNSTPSNQTTNIHQHIVLLQKSYRFQASSGIGQLANAVKQGHIAHVQQLLQKQPKTDQHNRQHHFSDIEWYPLTILNTHFNDWIMQAWADYFAQLKQPFENIDKARLFNAFSAFRILTALRIGRTGSEAINQRVDYHLQQRFLKSQHPWYHGRPILITHNHYASGLFNGDIGIILKQKTETGQTQLNAWFPTVQQTWRSFPISRLPAHETAWAMTIHKSQGSEFDCVLMILPEQDSPVLNRSLIYTGLSRAKNKLTLISPIDVLMTGLSHQQWRSTGLTEQSFNHNLDKT